MRWAAQNNLIKKNGIQNLNLSYWKLNQTLFQVESGFEKITETKWSVETISNALVYDSLLKQGCIETAKNFLKSQNKKDKYEKFGKSPLFGACAVESTSDAWAIYDSLLKVA